MPEFTKEEGTANIINYNIFLMNSERLRLTMALTMPPVTSAIHMLITVLNISNVVKPMLCNMKQ
jgi:hypothetical protein